MRQICLRKFCLFFFAEPNLKICLLIWEVLIMKKFKLYFGIFCICMVTILSGMYSIFFIKHMLFKPVGIIATAYVAKSWYNCHKEALISFKKIKL